MSADEQMPANTATATTTEAAVETDVVTGAIIEQERSEKILKAKELYSHGSRNFLVKSYVEAADELSQVCALYEELYGEQSDELGMPYLLYAKSLIALALDENKVIDVPDEEALEDDDDDDDADEDDNGAAAVDDKDASSAAQSVKTEKANGVEATTAAATSSSLNGAASADNKATPTAEQQGEEADSTAAVAADASAAAATGDEAAHATEPTTAEKTPEDAQVSSTDEKAEDAAGSVAPSATNGATSAAVAANGTAAAAVAALPVMDGEKPSTSNGENGAAAQEEEEEEENEAASNLQLAWEILELAAKIFSRQGTSGLSNLAEVQTELANIEFENNIPESAREDYVKALKIYSELPRNYRRAMAEIHYKIGLTYLMQQLNKEGAESLKVACTLIDAEIEEIQEKGDELTDKDKNNIQDMEETKQEIWAKIAEIEDTQAQNIAEVRAALDSYIKPINSENADGAGPSSSSSCTSSTVATSGAAGASSSSSITSSSKPTDISHLIKRKKPDEHTSEAEAAASPAKRPAV